MSSVIARAEKLAATPVDMAPVAPNTAVSMRAPWDAVKKVVNVNIPLRRPTRACKSSRTMDLNHSTGGFESQAELAAWDAASDEAWGMLDGSAE